MLRDHFAKRTKKKSWEIIWYIYPSIYVLYKICVSKLWTIKFVGKQKVEQKMF